VFTQTVNTVFFTMPSDGWAISQLYYDANAGETIPGTVYHTTNGGATWTTGLNATNASYTLISFVSPTVGFIYDSGNDVIDRTTDGGSTWSSVSDPAAPNNSSPDVLVFKSSSAGLLVAHNNFYETSDGGSTWQDEGGVQDTSYLRVVSAGYAGGNRFAIGHDYSGSYFLYYGYPAPPPTSTPTNTSQPTDTPRPTNTPSPTSTVYPFSTTQPASTPYPPVVPSATRVPVQPTTAPQQATSAPPQQATSVPPSRAQSTATTAPTSSASSFGGGFPTSTPGRTARPQNTPEATVTDAPTSVDASPTPASGSLPTRAFQARGCYGSSLTQIIACTEPSILRIAVHLSNGDSEGTGFVVQSDNSGVYVLTNRHVVDGGSPSTIKVLSPDGKMAYHVLSVASNTAKVDGVGDFAVVRLSPSALRPLVFGSSSSLSAGAPIITIGYGAAFQLLGPPSVAQGIVSAVGRDIGGDSGPSWIQHTSAINPGNSGGPLLDAQGRVVGVNTRAIEQLTDGGSAQGVFLAIPASIVEPGAQRLIAQLRHPGSQLLRTTRLAHLRVTTPYYAVTLPLGWTTSKLSRTGPVVSSRDQLVEIALRSAPLQGSVLPITLRKDISALAAKSGHAPVIHYVNTTVGKLHGLLGAITFPHASYKMRILVLADPKHGSLDVFQELIRLGAAAHDLGEAWLVIRSLVTT